MEILNILSAINLPLENFWTLVIRFGFNLISTFFIVVMLYARNSKRRDFYFSYFAISVAVFMLVFLLQGVTLELGFALGLFAIFGIIRYRTDAIPIKEMTYLFVIIAVSVINALSKDFLGYLELTLVNILLVGALWVLEHILMLRQEDSLQILYENIENIHEDKEAELIADIEKRTGIKVRRYRIDKVDFLRDVARITVYFFVNGSSKMKTTK
ncbi:MAG: DUF4956 domain-containing protein [Bacteroidales bacterium]|nr:DUF4956 domain-containing protein [Bacteroidales bacterium]